MSLNHALIVTTQLSLFYVISVCTAKVFNVCCGLLCI